MSGLDENALKIVKIGQEVGGWFGRGQILDASSIENQTLQDLRMLNSVLNFLKYQQFYTILQESETAKRAATYRVS